MKSEVTRVLLATAFVLLLVVGVQGQQQSDEAQIKQYRSEIQLLLDITPSPGATEESDHRNALLSLRSKLRDLLIEKRGALKSRVRNLQSPNASPEIQGYLKVLERELANVNTDVEGIERDLRKSASTASGIVIPVPPAPVVEVPPAPANPNGTRDGTDVEANAAAKALFEKSVNEIAAKDPKEVVAPIEIAESKIPEPRCNDRGRPARTTFSKFDEAICRLASDVSGEGRPILLEQDSQNLFSILIAKLLKTTGDENYASFVTEAQEARTDQQMGAGPSSNGTTSLVVKGGVPSALGFAVENGAAVQSRSDTTVTFRINPAGTLDLFTNKGFITGFRQSENDPVMKFLRKSSIGLTFDTARGNEPGVFTGSRQQLSAFSYRVEFFNDRDPRLAKYEADWEKFVADEGVKLAQVIYKTTLGTTNFGGPTDVDTFIDPALQAWLNKTNEAIGSVAAGLAPEERINAVATILRSQADLLPVKVVAPQTVEAITLFAKQLKDYTKAKDKILDRIAKGKILTFEYTNKREVSAPDTSNFNFIAATGLENRRVELTANGSLTIFNKRPVSTNPAITRAGRVRDFQFAGQLDLPFGNVRGAGQFIFWFSGRYERLLENASTLDGSIMPNTKGDIAVGQFGLKIPIKGLGMKIPISVTFANRTELVKEKEVRGNFGFTFNLDTLLSKFNPF